MKVLAFDLETTSADPFAARLVTAYLGLLDEGGEIIREREWMARPEGFSIPSEATAVHGVTTAEAMSSGAPLTRVVNEMLAILALHIAEGTPVAGQNLAYDLTVLAAECERLAPPRDASLLERALVLDSLVLDRRLYPKRGGGRRLVDLVHYYHLHFPGGEYHTARFDAIAAGRIVQKQLEHDLLRGMPLDVLHEAQALWYRDQALDYQAYRRRTDPTFTATKDWPLWKKEAA